jgi:hypothetical protein
MNPISSSCRKTLALFALSAGAVMSLPVAHAADASLMFSGDFESGDLTGWSIVRENVPEVQSKKTRAGRYALKSTLNFFNGEDASYLLREREEVRAKAPDTKVGSEYWYGFSIYLPGAAEGADEYVADRYWEMVAQWWAPQDDPAESGRGPPLSLRTSVNGIGGRWYIYGKYGAKAIDADPDGIFLTDLGPYETGKWTDWVFRVKWSYMNDGIVEVWKDGKKVVSRVNAPIGFNDQKGPFFKMGLYKGQWKHEPADGSTLDAVNYRVLYHDEFRMADGRGSYAAVAPGGLTAIPSAPSGLQLE